MTDAFAPYVSARYDATFDSVEALAQWIMNRENYAAPYETLRDVICHAATTNAVEIRWFLSPITFTVLNLPEAAPLFAPPAIDSVNLEIVNSVLNRCVEIARGK